MALKTYKIYIWTRGAGVPSGTVAEFDNRADAEFAITQLESFGSGYREASVKTVRLYE